LRAVTSETSFALAFGRRGPRPQPRPSGLESAKISAIWLWRVDFPGNPKPARVIPRPSSRDCSPTIHRWRRKTAPSIKWFDRDFKKALADTPVISKKRFSSHAGQGKLVSDVTGAPTMGAQFANMAAGSPYDQGMAAKKITELYLVNGLLLMFEGHHHAKGDIENPEAAASRIRSSTTLIATGRFRRPSQPSAAGPAIRAPIRPGQPRTKRRFVIPDRVARLIDRMAKKKSWRHVPGSLIFPSQLAARASLFVFVLGFGANGCSFRFGSFAAMNCPPRRSHPVIG